MRSRIRPLKIVADDEREKEEREGRRLSICVESSVDIIQGVSHW